MEFSEVVTVGEAARWLKLSRSKVYQLIQTGQIPALRIGRNVRLWGPDVERWLQQCKVDGVAAENKE